MKHTFNARQIQMERLQNGKLCNELSINLLLFDVVWCIQAENVEKTQPDNYSSGLCLRAG